MNIAAKVAKDKQRHPEDFCPHKGCLWRVQTRKGYTPCPKHGERSEGRVGLGNPEPSPASGVETSNGERKLGTGTTAPHRCDATCYKNQGDRKLAF